MHVAVAIVGFRNASDIARCLKALEASTYADFEIVICENGGAEAFEALQAAIPRTLAGGQSVRAIQASGNLGYGGGVNVCLAETPQADAWWVLNPDTEPYPDALELQVARLRAGDCEAVGCTLHLPDGRAQSHGGRWSSWLARAVSIGHGGPLDPPPDPVEIERSQNYLNGASMMIGKAFLKATGSMREDYFLYCEEVEWCLRGMARGMRLGYAPGALVLHHQGTTTGNSIDLRRRTRGPIYLNERNKLLLTRDCFPGRLPVAAAASLAVLMLRFGKRRAWRQIGYALGGWWAGLRGERGVPPWLSEGRDAG